MVAKNPAEGPLYFAFAVEPAKQVVHTLWVDTDRDRCEEKGQSLRTGGMTHFAVIDMNRPEAPKELHDWLIGCGVPWADGAHLIKSLGTQLALIDELSQDPKED